MQDQRIYRLLEALTRPTFIWRMSRGLIKDSRLGAGAEKRHDNALTEAESLVRQWVRDNPKTAQLDWCECGEVMAWNSGDGAWVHVPADISNVIDGHDATRGEV